jgi:hypothetical protein
LICVNQLFGIRQKNYTVGPARCGIGGHAVRGHCAQKLQGPGGQMKFKASWLQTAELIPINPFRAIQPYDYGVIDRRYRVTPTRKAKELSMISSNRDSVAAQLPQKSNVLGDCAPSPMPQQDTVGYRGYEMHPQKFVQLVGCHDLNAARHEGGHLH